ncbi:acyloxyacyl hydrolase [Pseudoalteromonas sp. MMG010]|uniref:acyloxyacyl hydrolase n=1 Tax=Pseudoalteromonas sp. MMG010 TaxID=2822685 RepID=UPI001B3A71F7|nr:acyloxyacyl hydrolase [Pseudoalteromonas sp. MMG010]MBQ4833307.1 acyloxyacyl hydrolase [Pseudoalteromonas sp. MMG010]
MRLLKAPITLTLILLLALTSKAHAQRLHGYSVDVLKGEGNVAGIKLAHKYYAPQLQKLVGHAKFYFESSVNVWQFHKSGHSQSNTVVAISPVLQFPAFNFNGKLFSIEAGIGISLINKTYFAEKNLSTHYQFEDRIGLVTTIGDTDLALRVIHYSNAGFKHPNPGINFLTLSLSQPL